MYKIMKYLLIRIAKFTFVIFFLPLFSSYTFNNYHQHHLLLRPVNYYIPTLTNDRQYVR